MILVDIVEGLEAIEDGLDTVKRELMYNNLSVDDLIKLYADLSVLSVRLKGIREHVHFELKEKEVIK